MIKNDGIMKWATIMKEIYNTIFEQKSLFFYRLLFMWALEDETDSRIYDFNKLYW